MNGVEYIDMSGRRSSKMRYKTFFGPCPGAGVGDTGVGLGAGVGLGGVGLGVG